jgi:chromosome segregation ATPase
VKEDQARLNREIASLEAEKAQIQTKLTEKGISPKELGELYEKHNQIQTEYANKSAAMEEAKKSLKEKNDKLIQMKQQVPCM